MGLAVPRSGCWSGWCRSRHSWSGPGSGAGLRRWRQGGGAPAPRPAESWPWRSHGKTGHPLTQLHLTSPCRRRYTPAPRQAPRHCRRWRPRGPHSRTRGGRRRRPPRRRALGLRARRSLCPQPASARPRRGPMSSLLPPARGLSTETLVPSTGSSTVICWGGTWCRLTAAPVDPRLGRALAARHTSPCSPIKPCWMVHTRRSYCHKCHKN